MKCLFVLIVCGLICGCGQDDQADASVQEKRSPPSILNTQLDALEKARAVEQSLQEATDARDEEMRKQGI